jgi:hypothetical protein
MEAMLAQKIRVAIRKRPLSSSEKRNGERDIVSAAVCESARVGEAISRTLAGCRHGRRARAKTET